MTKSASNAPKEEPGIAFCSLTFYFSAVGRFLNYSAAVASSMCAPKMGTLDAEENIYHLVRFSHGKMIT